MSVEDIQDHKIVSEGQMNVSRFYVDTGSGETTCVNCEQTIKPSEKRIIFTDGDERSESHFDCVGGGVVLENKLYSFGNHELGFGECPDCGREDNVQTYVLASSLTEAIRKAYEYSNPPLELDEILECECCRETAIYEGTLHGKCWNCTSKNLEFNDIIENVTHRW